jgi:hypothetical protein
MTDEPRKEIRKGYFYGYSVKEVLDAVLWGNQTNYSDELKGRGE